MAARGSRMIHVNLSSLLSPLHLQASTARRQAGGFDDNIGETSDLGNKTRPPCEWAKTLPETNHFAPKNGWLEDDLRFLLGRLGPFSGAMLVSGRVNVVTWLQSWNAIQNHPQYPMMQSTKPSTISHDTKTIHNIQQKVLFQIFLFQSTLWSLTQKREIPSAPSFVRWMFKRSLASRWMFWPSLVAKTRGVRQGCTPGPTFNGCFWFP